MGVLNGFRVLEMAGAGPVPFCAMMLADMGADVVRIDRVGAPQTPFPIDPRKDVIARGRRSIAVDLKNPAGRDLLLGLSAKSDALLEGFRPGVMERLGLDPETCWRQNPKLVYGRATGWGQSGPLAARAGHDINYLALAGVLHGIGHKGGRPVPPLNLVGDYGGGGMILAVGVLAALLDASRSGKGQVVDAAMVDGASLLQTVLYGLAAMGTWNETRGDNILDSGCFYYDVYETADGRFLAVGALEPQFFVALIEGLGLSVADFPDRENPRHWAAYRQKLDAVFRTKSRDVWARQFAGTDACVTPVLTMSEAVNHPAAQERQAFAHVDGIAQPAPAPRFRSTPEDIQRKPPLPGEHTGSVLAELGYSADDLGRLRACGAIGGAL